jgi:RimJ/RimL family protein N-acetyltransferase
MGIELPTVLLRRPEPKDIEQMYGYRNDPDVARMLGGFSVGFSRQDLEDWIERHRNRTDEIIWVIATKPSDDCIGHVGLYEIDYRVAKAEFAICIGDKTKWTKGLGAAIGKAVLRYAFRELNLHKVSLEVLDFNEAAIKLYEKLAFKLDGRLRADQFRDGKHVDSLVMSILAEEWESAHGAD